MTSVARDVGEDIYDLKGLIEDFLALFDEVLLQESHEEIEFRPIKQMPHVAQGGRDAVFLGLESLNYDDE